MNKQAAADFLGVSVRAVERYTQQAKLSVTYAKGRTRPVAEYRQEELDALRAEINANLYHQRPAHEKPNPANSEQAGGLVAIPPSQALQRVGSEQSIQALGQAIADALRATQDGKGSGSVAIADLAHKLMLSIDEAARLSGLSANHIRGAIHDGTLKAKIVGRGWKVNPEVLKAYAARLLK